MRTLVMGHLTMGAPGRRMSSDGGWLRRRGGRGERSSGPRGGVLALTRGGFVGRGGRRVDYFPLLKAPGVLSALHLGYGVIGNTGDSGSSILGSSPGTPARKQ